MGRELAAPVKDPCAHDLRETLPAVERELVAVRVDSFLATKPLAEGDGWK